MQVESNAGIEALKALRGLSSKNKVLDLHRTKYLYNPDRAEELWTWYLEFMVIKIFANDEADENKMQLSASPEVDAVWHSHLLNT